MMTAQPRPFDLLIPGEINPDLILTGNVEPEFGQVEKLVEHAALTVGSSSVITACGAARLGLKIAFVGKCGDDIFGRFMLEEMQQRGVNVDYVTRVPGGQTGLTVVLNRGTDRAMLTRLGLISALTAEDIPDSLLRQTRHLHIASYFLQESLQPGLPRLLERARALGVTASLDTNYDPAEAWRGFDALLPLVNILLPNETEAKSISRADTLEDAAARLAAQVETLAIKLGAAGALACRNGQQARVDSIPAQVADTVGAGDSFNAGFLFGYLRGWDLEKALKMAAVCGALSTQQPGGIAGQPTLAEAQIHL